MQPSIPPRRLVGVSFFLSLMVVGCGSSKERPSTTAPTPLDSAPPPVIETSPLPPDANSTPAKGDPGTNAAYTRKQFRELFIGKTKDELLKVLGKPEADSADGDDEYWSYYSRTTNDDGSVDMFARIAIHKGVARRVAFAGAE